MSTKEISEKLVQLCKEGKALEALDSLYHPEAVSVEAADMPDMPAEMTGIDAIKNKNNWWVENHEIHRLDIKGPYPHGDRFAVYFSMDVTNKPSGQRMEMDEVALYTIESGKIVKEEFFYPMG